MPDLNLNPDALAVAEFSVGDRWDGNCFAGTAEEIAEGAIRAYLTALPAQPELSENSKPNQNLEFDTVNSVEELEALPAKTVILDRIGDVSVIAETREFMCHDGESYTLDEVSADLPATVLYKPGE